jgi:hypothetical protein
MASVAISAVSVLLSGASPDSGTTAASGETITITAPAGQALDLSKLVLRFRTSAGSATTNLSLGAGSTYTSVGLGAYVVTVPSSGGVIYVGGKDFESARFLTTSAQSVIFTQVTGASAINVEAVQLPHGFTA